MEEKQILEQAILLFTRFGIKSMTMDEVSRNLGISKKTLYQFVENKNDLVIKAISNHIEDEQCDIDKIFSEDKNAIDEILEITKMVGSDMKEMHPSVMFDLKKYHRQAWQILVDHKDKYIHKNIKHNLEKGVKSGLYRSNLNTEIITKLYLSMVNTIMDPDSLSVQGLSIMDLHTEMMRYHIRGIASAKGREYMKKKLNHENE